MDYVLQAGQGRIGDAAYSVPEIGIPALSNQDGEAPAPEST